MEQSILKKIANYGYDVMKVHNRQRKGRNIKYHIGIDKPDSIAKKFLYITDNNEYIVSYILRTENIELLKDIVDVWLGNINHKKDVTWTLPIDVMINLTHYMLARRLKTKKIFTNNELNYIANLSRDQLITLLGNKYNGPTDHASLLFAILSGDSTRRPHSPIFEQRYQIIKDYPMYVMYVLGYNFRGPIESDMDTVYTRVAMSPKPEIEQILIEVNETSVDYFMRYYGVAIPHNFTGYQLEPKNFRNPTHKVKFFMEEIVDYGPVFKRTANENIDISQAVLVPSVDGESISREPYLILEKFTTDELLKEFGDFDGNWSSRSSLIYKIVHREFNKHVHQRS